MKKLILGVLGLVLLVSMSHGILVKNSDFPVSSQEAIYNTTLTTAETVYTVTLDQGTTAQLDIQARGGDIRFCTGGTTTEAFWTITDGSTRWNQYILPLRNTIYWS